MKLANIGLNPHGGIGRHKKFKPSRFKHKSSSLFGGTISLEQDIEDLKSDIKHLEDVLQNWHDQDGCDECKEDHLRLLKWLKTRLRYFEKDYMDVV